MNLSDEQENFLRSFASQIKGCNERNVTVQKPFRNSSDISNPNNPKIFGIYLQYIFSITDTLNTMLWETTGTHIKTNVSARFSDTLVSKPDPKASFHG